MSPAARECGAVVLCSTWRPAFTARPSWLAAQWLEHWRRLAIRRRLQISRAVDEPMEGRRR